MPIYEYVCSQGHTFEVIQRFSDEPLTTCQQCDQPVRKVLHSPAIHFKGSGFHNTDYGKKKDRPKPEGGDTSSASGESKASGAGGSDSSTGSSDKSTKADSKPAPKSSE